jgi:pyridoxamine 5'-phosphate oxidase family protein
MSVFTPKELEFLQGQRLGRLATIDPQGRPQNSPVGFRYNPQADAIDIAGAAMSQTRKFRNVQANVNVAFVVDEVLAPWQPRGVEIRGSAQALLTGGKGMYAPGYPEDDTIIRITPEKIISWGLETDEKGNATRERSSRKVNPPTNER